MRCFLFSSLLFPSHPISSALFSSHLISPLLFTFDTLHRERHYTQWHRKLCFDLSHWNSLDFISTLYSFKWPPWDWHLISRTTSNTTSDSLYFSLYTCPSVCPLCFYVSDTYAFWDEMCVNFPPLLITSLSPCMTPVRRHYTSSLGRSRCYIQCYC